MTTFTYGRGLAGRQIPGQPFPDHGKQESDEKTFHGGNYATPHPEFYPGIDIGIPTGTKSRKASPEDTCAAVAAALKAGADGLILVTHNVRDFAGAEEYGINVIRPHEFLRLLKGMS